MNAEKICGHWGILATCRDGTTLQVTTSGNGNAPDKQGGQHTNASTVWYRVLKLENNEYIALTEFMRLPQRGAHKYLELIEVSDNLEEFQLLMEEL